MFGGCLSHRLTRGWPHRNHAAPSWSAGTVAMAGIFMRQPLMLLMTGLLAAASIAIALVASSLERPPATETTDSASVLAVYRFYEAVNDMISTGDPTSLHQFVHPDLHDLDARSEEHTSELQSPCNTISRLLLEKKK